MSEQAAEYRLVDVSTGEILGPVTLGKRVSVPAVKRTITPTTSGFLWDDLPFAVALVDAEIVVPDDHVADDNGEKYDDTLGTVVRDYTTRELTEEEKGTRSVAEAVADLAATDALMAPVTDALWDALLAAGTLREDALPAEYVNLLDERRALRLIIAGGGGAKA